MNVQRDPTAMELYEALKAIAEDPAREHLLDLPIYADADSGYVLFGNIVSTGHALFIEADTCYSATLCPLDTHYL